MNSDVTQLKTSQSETALRFERQVHQCREGLNEAFHRHEHTVQLALARVQEESLDPLAEQHGLLRRSVSALATGVFRAARFTGLLGSGDEDGSVWREEKIDEDGSVWR